MKDIEYHDLPEGWGSGGGEGTGGFIGKKDYYVDWFISDKYDLEITVDSPMGSLEHIIQVSERDPENPYNKLVENFVVDDDTLLSYLEAKQKAWNRLIEIMVLINEGNIKI